MNPRLPGTTATITYDYDGDEVDTPAGGDYLATWSERTQRWGSAYLIDAVRRVNSRTHRCRLSLRCIRLAGLEDVPPDVRVYPIVWYPRRRKPRLR